MRPDRDRPDVRASAVALAALAALAGGCDAYGPGSAAPPPDEPASASFALAGVPTMGYPSYDERLELVALNRARADPNNVPLGTASSCSVTWPAQPPLVYNFDAGQSARFHCVHLGTNSGGLSHDSFCDLRSDIEMTGCTAASCSCTAGTECWSCATLGGCGTDAFSRMALFGFGGSGENGAAGYADAWAAVEGWVTECPPADGHRSISTSSSYNVVGPGAWAGGGGCWSTYHFSDFGYIGGTAIPRIASGVQVPASGSASTSFQFYANYYDAGGSPPSSIDVVVDGTCHPMTSELGSGGNRTYLFTGALPSGCHEYYFLANDAGGTRVTWPSTGAYHFNGGAACAGGEYITTQTPASCESVSCGDGTCGAGETCTNCATDCGACPPTCGNGVCEAAETCAGCGADCGACPPMCGNGTCEPGEECMSCPADCGVCPPTCGNGACDAGETCSACPGDCGACPVTCGNAVCEAGENCMGCPGDCGACPPFCGNATCDGAETCGTCEMDCGACPPCMDGAMQACGLGACAGMQTCTGSTWDACSGAPPAAGETCDNGVDDDCNGLTDEFCAGADGGAAGDGGVEPILGVPVVAIGGCGCRLAGSTHRGGGCAAGLLAMLGLGLVAARRRRG